MKLFSVNFSFKLLKIVVSTKHLNSITDHEINTQTYDDSLLELEGWEGYQL